MTLDDLHIKASVVLRVMGDPRLVEMSKGSARVAEVQAAFLVRSIFTLALGQNVAAFQLSALLHLED